MWGILQLSVCQDKPTQVQSPLKCWGSGASHCLTILMSILLEDLPGAGRKPAELLLMPSDNCPQKRLLNAALSSALYLKFLDSNFFLVVLSFWGANLLSGHLPSAGYLLPILRPAVVFRGTGQPDGLNNVLDTALCQHCFWWRVRQGFGKHQCLFFSTFSF